MFSLSILLVFGLIIINANGHLLKQLLQNMHAKYHINHGHHSSLFVHSGPGRFPPFGPQNQFGPEYGSYGPPPFGFPPHHTSYQHSPHPHNCQNQPCHFSYPNNGQLPYPSFNPDHTPNYQPTPINTPNTININNINANSQQDATSISSAPTDVNINVIPTALNVPNYSSGSNGLGSDVLTHSQSVHGENQADINYGQTQALHPSTAVSNGYPTNNNINMNNNAYSNGQTNSWNAHTTKLNAQTTNLNAQTTNLNAQTTNFNGNSNNAMLDTTNQFGIDLNALNAMNNILNGAAANPLSNNANNPNNNNMPQPVPAYTELPPVSSTTNRDGMEYDIDIRFGDNEKKN